VEDRFDGGLFAGRIHAACHEGFLNRSTRRSISGYHEEKNVHPAFYNIVSGQRAEIAAACLDEEREIIDPRGRIPFPQDCQTEVFSPESVRHREEGRDDPFASF
jgi:hypothetical protein